MKQGLERQAKKTCTPHSEAENTAHRNTRRAYWIRRIPNCLYPSCRIRACQDRFARKAFGLREPKPEIDRARRLRDRRLDCLGRLLHTSEGSGVTANEKENSAVLEGSSCSARSFASLLDRSSIQVVNRRHCLEYDAVEN